MAKRDSWLRTWQEHRVHGTPSSNTCIGLRRRKCKVRAARTGGLTGYVTRIQKYTFSARTVGGWVGVVGPGRREYLLSDRIHIHRYTYIYIYISPGGKAEIVLGAPVKTAPADVTWARRPYKNIYTRIHAHIYV